MRISDAQASLAVTPAGRSDKRFIFLEWSNSAKKLGGDWGVGGLEEDQRFIFLEWPR